MEPKRPPPATTRDEARYSGWVRRASFLLNVDDVKLVAVPVALGTPEQPDSDV